MKSSIMTFVKALLPHSVQTQLSAWNTMRRGAHDPEVGLLPLLAGTGSFIDIGANLGSWTGPAARAFAHVHAFEPDPELAAAIKRMGPANVTVHRLALSNRTGTARFAVPVHHGMQVKTRGSLEPTANPGFEEQYFEVPITPLDALNLTGVDAMKIDVEGHEEAVLEGAGALIARERPSMIIEIEERHHPGRSEKIIASILDRDYSAYILARGRLERFQRGQVNMLQPAGLTVGVGQEKSAGYINNFIFIPNEKKHLVSSSLQGQPGELLL